MKTDIESLRKELEGITPGPWSDHAGLISSQPSPGKRATLLKAAAADTRGIVAMRNAIEGLIEDLEKSWERIADLEDDLIQARIREMEGAKSARERA